jgi:hypothetical protein
LGQPVLVENRVSGGEGQPLELSRCRFQTIDLSGGKLPVGGLIPVGRAVIECVIGQADTLYASLPITAGGYRQAAQLLTSGFSAAPADSPKAAARDAAADHEVTGMAATGPAINIVSSGSAYLATGLGLDTILLIDTVAPPVATGSHGQRHGGKKGEIDFSGLAHEG